MPCPLSLGPRYRIELKPNNPFLLFLASHQRQGGNSSPPKKDRLNSLPIAQPHPRNMLCARKRAVQPDQRGLHFSSLPIALIHRRNRPLRAASANRPN
jgi:hypothetical protein